MLIAALHTIHDPAVFWESAQEHVPKAPDGIRIVQIAPSPDGTQASCLWEAPSIEPLRDWIAGLVGHVSENAYFEVNMTNGLGLPTT